MQNDQLKYFREASHRHASWKIYLMSILWYTITLEIVRQDKINSNRRNTSNGKQHSRSIHIQRITHEAHINSTQLMRKL